MIHVPGCEDQHQQCWSSIQPVFMICILQVKRRAGPCCGDLVNTRILQACWNKKLRNP
jgi:hypothetical protein